MGKGKVADMFGMGFQACATCNGKGTQKCTTCDGFGLNPHPEDYLATVLKAEIWALEQMVPHDASSTQSAGWSNARLNPASAIPLLKLETISEFDPRKCIYRMGTWNLP
jgi:hypothetical protein